MPPENVLHIRVGQEDAMDGKRSILTSQINSLNIARFIGRYRGLRLEEFNHKLRMYNKMKETKANIKKLQSLLPEPKIPKILKKTNEPEPKREHERKVPEYRDSDIESQLREIEGRLARLQGNY